jgi:hypothetical protein
MNPQFDLVMSLLNVPKYVPHAWPHLTQRSRAATASNYRWLVGMLPVTYRPL